ncbi:MAG: 2-dehydropantoate 2-reductase [Alcanivoracaceae bacterium]|nr:2-dehydropantoate 2-reductase [Alcanivoracaceae bacterium]
MHWHLLGLGSLGTLCAARLMQAGEQLTALPRRPATSVSRTLIYPQSHPQKAALTLTLSCQNDRPIECLLITVKAGDTVSALTPVLHRLAHDATIICLQNGMGTLDNISLPANAQVIYATTTDGAWRDADQIHVVAENETLMGNGSEQAPHWFTDIAPYWPGLTWTTEIDLARWQKLAINAVINPLTALQRCKNGELLDNGQRQQEMATLAAEVDKLCAQILPHWTANTRLRSETIAAQTAGNTSSMLADVLNGRATEIDYINGYLLRRAEQHNIAMPAHAALIRKIQALVH